MGSTIRRPWRLSAYSFSQFTTLISVRPSSSLSWVQDGIDGTESSAIEAWSYIAYEDPAIASSFVSLDWVRDGVDVPEAYLVRYFAYLAREDANAASQILRMPFLRTIEPADLSAVESLTRLAIFRA